MNILKQYDIQFGGLKLGKHEFEFDADSSLFEYFDYSEIKNGDIKICVSLDKHANLLTLNFSIKGTVDMICDRCLDPLNIPIDSQYKLIMKFGNKIYEETDEIIVLAQDENQINIAHYIYEYTVLALPKSKIHAEGLCNVEMIRIIDDMQPSNKKKRADERWSALKALTIKN